ncbi:hypothetical protein CHUAL_001352 [Chamberlinius hualienensis]
MTMGDESPVAALVLPVLIKPILEKLGNKDAKACQILKNSLSKVEASHPGFVHDFVVGLQFKADLSVNMNESILRLQGSVSDSDEFRSTRMDEPFQELNKKAAALKKILSRIPDEINDRKTFLETIKEIASAIKKLLDAVNEVSVYIPTMPGKQAVEQRKKEFVKYSKRFSNTLKDYFKEGQANSVYLSANYLIYHTNLIVVTVKQRCD